jgi:ABC-type multidrug transport system ATPase subunit
MSHNPKLLIAAHPTRGVDVGAQAQIWDQIREARREGLAVLLISADLDELIGLSDTLRVMYRGRLVADADPGTITPEELGSAMTGAATGHLEHPAEAPPAEEAARPRDGAAPPAAETSAAGVPPQQAADAPADTAATKDEPR